MTWAEARQSIFRLTSIELDTLKALAAGLTVPEMAAIRYVSIDTVKTQRRRLYAKMGVPNGMLAVARGYCWGILDPDVPPELAFERHVRYTDTFVQPADMPSDGWVEVPRGPAPRKSMTAERPRSQANRTGKLAEVQQKMETEDLYKRFPALAALEDRAATRTVGRLDE